MPATSPFRARSLAGLSAVGVLAVVYFLTARLGLSLGIVEQVTAVWPPTGIALAAVWILGPQIAAPGIWIGALVANLAAAEPVGTALGIATGNTLEALAGTWMLRRVGFAATLERLRDVLAFLGAAVLAAPVSALLGVTSLCLGGVHPWSSFGALASVWWLGDVMGALLVAPVLLTRVPWRRRPWRPLRMAEFALLFAGVAAASLFVFYRGPAGPHLPRPLPFLVFPFVVVTALRFSQRQTSLAILATSCIAIWGTTQGQGPFGFTGDPWVPLQAFIAVVAMTGLMLSAAISERDRAERYRAAEHSVTRILASAGTLEEAAPGIIEAICARLGFELGALWRVDREHEVLRCVELWHQPALRAPAFVAETRARVFPPGIGLPGRVWSSGRPAWIEDVVKDANFPRAPLAARERLHGAFALPIVLEREVLGVIEFFSHQIRQPDDELLQLLTSVGSQIGQYIERKSAEEAVRTSEARKAGVLASVLDGILTIDHEGRLLEFNSGAERIFGYSAAQVLGRDMASLIIPERYRAQHQAGLAHFAKTGRGSMLDRRLELFALRADGSEFPVELTIRRVVGSEPPMITGYARDITLRKQTEEERTRLLHREQLARSRAEALAEDLRAQQTAKDRFLAMLGHELRNPLAPVTNALEVLRLRGGADPETRKMLDIIARQANHMTRLVEDLLDVSRIGRGTISVRREPIDLGEVVERVVDSSRHLLEENKHRLVLALGEEPFPILGDPTRLEQVLSNLLNNAVRYTPPGGEIELSLQREAGSAVLRVRDNGIGIRPELLERVFDAFQQADRVPGSVQEGLGLGLTLVKDLVALHDGSVAAFSSGPGSGSEFVVRLPLAPEEACAARERAGPALATTPKRVLVVDDNRDAGETLATLVRLAGHEATVAHDGAAALEQFRVSHPDIVLLDIELPHGMSGHEVALRIAREPGAERVMLVAVTGYGQQEDRERSREAGFHLHLVKPVDPRELERVLASSR